MLAFILSRRDFREFDQMISLYTKERGKLELLARGVKKITSKNSAHLEPFCFVDATIEPGKEIDHLIKVQPVEYFSGIRTDLAKSLAARAAVSITDTLTQVGERDVKLFDMLHGWLKFLNTHTIFNHPLLDKEGVRHSDRGGFAVVTPPTAKPPRPRPAGYAPPYQGGDSDIRCEGVIPSLVDAYIVQLLHCLGFTPVLNQCVVCEKSFQEIMKESLTIGDELMPARRSGGAMNSGFYFAGGGLICLSCRLQKEMIDEEVYDCTLKEVSDLALLLKGDWRKIAEFGLSEIEQKKVHRLVYEYAVFHSERKIVDWYQILSSSV